MGINVEVLSVPFLRPLSPDCVKASIGRGLVTVEEHSVNGGLGSAVLDAVIACGEVPHLRKVGTPAATPSDIGESGYMWQSAGLTTEAVIEAVQSLLKPS
jgi:transketolase